MTSSATGTHHSSRPYTAGPTRTRLRTVGIWCDANLTVQRRDQDWLIRGQGSGGAVNDIGRYVSFCKQDGSALSWLHPACTRY